MNDVELKSLLNAVLFPGGKCQKCGCGPRDHGWRIYQGEVWCANCTEGIQMAQAVFGGPRVCYRDVYNIDDAELRRDGSNELAPTREGAS